MDSPVFGGLLHQSGNRFTAPCGPLRVPTPPLEGLQKNVMTAAGLEGTQFAAVPMSRSRMQVFREAFEEKSQLYREMMVSSRGASLGWGTNGQLYNYTAAALPQDAGMHFMEAICQPSCRTVGYGADDLFEPVPVDAYAPEETKTVFHPPPPPRSLDDVQVPTYSMATIKPPPGLSLTSDDAGAPCAAGPPRHSEVVNASHFYGALPLASHEISVKDWKQTTQDSLATISTSSGLDGPGLQEEEEELPKKKKGGKQRFCKAKRDRYRHLVEGLVAQAKDDPASFNLAEHKLPPGIAASAEAQAKLLATVMKFAVAAGAAPACTPEEE